MVSDPFVQVNCDTPKCKYQDDIDYGVDGLKGVKESLKRMGWRLKGDKCYCPACERNLSTAKPSKDTTPCQP